MRKGFTLVEIMIVVAIVALLAAIAIPNLLRARVNANEANAQATLRTISTACETFAAANNGLYPVGEAALTGVTPAYLNRSYATCTAAAPCQGYAYTYSSIIVSGYKVDATPASATTGTRSFTICTGGRFAEAAGLVAPACP